MVESKLKLCAPSSSTLTVNCAREEEPYVLTYHSSTTHKMKCHTRGSYNLPESQQRPQFRGLSGYARTVFSRSRAASCRNAATRENTRQRLKASTCSDISMSGRGFTSK